ncbi:MAG: hypothetical protein IPP07_07885 [Holophagales bacterium]|nr:hypothetical protein [Holophagales bacterium]
MSSPRWRRTGGDPLSLSRLDVIANALGAVILLFFIVSTARPAVEAERTPPAGRAAYFRFDLSPSTPDDACGDALANLTLVFNERGGARRETLSLPFFEVPRNADLAELRSLAAGWAGKERLALQCTAGTATCTPSRSAPSSLRIVVLEARPGDWYADLTYAAERGADAWQPRCRSVRVTARPIALWANGRAPATHIRTQEISFGGTTSFEALNIN